MQYRGYEKNQYNYYFSRYIDNEDFSDEVLEYFFFIKNDEDAPMMYRVKASHTCGYIYYQRENYIQAALCFEWAIENRSYDKEFTGASFTNLGGMYFLGKGVIEDKDMAYKLWSIGDKDYHNQKCHDLLNEFFK